MPSMDTARSSESAGSAGRMICSLFTFVAPSHGNKAGQIVPPDKHTGEQLLAHDANHFVAILLILNADGGQDQVIIVLENTVAKGQRQFVLFLVGEVFCGVKPAYP